MSRDVAVEARYRDRNWLEERYIGRRLTMAQVADEAGCLPETVFYWLRKHGIPTRSRNETRTQQRVRFTCDQCGGPGVRREGRLLYTSRHFCSKACAMAWEGTRKLPPEAKALRIWARAELNKAVRRGAVLKPAACPSCGADRRLDAHHEDYTKPLDVHWRCRPCHHREFHPRL